MSLHLSLSTPCPATASPRGWQSAGMLVEFLREGSYRSIELHTAEIKNHFNKDSGNLAAIDGKAGQDNVSQQDKRSGRYRRNNAVPI